MQQAHNTCNQQPRHLAFPYISHTAECTARYNPRFRCVLRIRADDPDARVPLGLKYGASLEDVPTLLQHAKNLGLQVLGGGACLERSAPACALTSAAALGSQ